jgi:hypothetical protein
MDPNVVLPLCSSLLSFVFFVFLIDQWLERRRAYQLIWALGMLWYALSAGTEFLGGAVGWSEPLYRTWYLIGAVWVAGWLGLGTVYLLQRTRFGYAFAGSVALAGLFTFLAWRKYDYPDSGSSAYVYLALSFVLAVALAIETWRGRDRWANLAGAAIVVGSVVSLVMAVTATIPPPGYAIDPVTQIPTGELLPGYLRLLTPLFNVTGAFALTLGALYSAYMFMPKRRLIRYHINRADGMARFVANLAIAPVAITVNFIASVPGAIGDLFLGRLPTRVPATILIAIGGLIPAITSGANRFGATSAFFVGELLGVVFLFAGFLVSIEVFREVRVPFTHRILWSRRAEAIEA